jgi:hypothetical protein
MCFLYYYNGKMKSSISPSINKSNSLNNLLENDDKSSNSNKYINEMIQIKSILQNIQTTNPIINRIFKDVNKYIELNVSFDTLMSPFKINNNCNHSIIDDYIDLDPDNGGKQIKYCEYCYKTM